MGWGIGPRYIYIYSIHTFSLYDTSGTGRDSEDIKNRVGAGNEGTSGLEWYTYAKRFDASNAWASSFAKLDGKGVEDAGNFTSADILDEGHWNFNIENATVWPGDEKKCWVYIFQYSFDESCRTDGYSFIANDVKTRVKNDLHFFRAVYLVRKILAVVFTVAKPCSWDAHTVPALELVFGAVWRRTCNRRRWMYR